jgi:hypothetical protein
MSDSTSGGNGNFLGLDSATARNLLAFGAAAMTGANARSGPWLTNGSGPLGAIGAGLQGMMQNQYQQQQLNSEIGLRNAQAQQIGIENQLKQLQLPYARALAGAQTQLLNNPSFMQRLMQGGMGGSGMPVMPPGSPAPSTQSPGINSPSIVPVEQRSGLINDAVQGTTVPPELFGAQIDKESSWNIGARGAPVAAPGGGTQQAISLAQILPSTAANPGYGIQGVQPETLDGPGGVQANLKLGAQYLDALGKSIGIKSQADWALRPDLATRALSMYYSGNANPTAANLAYANDVMGRAKAGWSGSPNPAPYKVAQAGNQLVPAPASGGGPTGTRMVPLPGAMPQQGVPLAPQGGGIPPHGCTRWRDATGSNGRAAGRCSDGCSTRNGRWDAARWCASADATEPGCSGKSGSI